MRPWVKDGDYTALNIVLCSLLVLLVCMQLLSLAAFIYSFIPIPLSPMVGELFPRHRQEVAPEREMFLFRCFVLAVILGQALCLWKVKGRLNTRELSRTLWPACLVEGWWLFLMLFVAFKGFVYGFQGWTKGLMVVAFLGSVVHKLFWGEIRSFIGRLYGRCAGQPAMAAKIADIGFPILIAALIFIPDLTAVAGRIYMGDNFHHMDIALMTQLWTYLKGGILNIDVYAQYGLGIPIFIGLIAKALGVLSYEGVIGILVWGSITYYILAYFFLRSWLRNVPLAIAGTLIAIKWQIFHPGNYPITYTYPFSTVFRFLFDIALFALLLGHIRKENILYLYGASFVCGLALFSESDTGIYLTLSYLFYLGWRAVIGIIDNRQDWLRVLRDFFFCGGAIILSLFALLTVFQGACAWSGAFWSNMGERIKIFLIGHGNLPIYQSLQDGEYLSSLMGFILPLVYCMVLIAIVGLCLLGRIHRRHILAAVLSVYGLGLYHYYVCRSGATSYYTGCIPFVLVCCYLVHAISKDWTAAVKRGVWTAVLCVSVFALFSNHSYLSYPNMLNVSRNPIVAPLITPKIEGMDHYFNHISRRVQEGWKFPTNSLGEKDEYLKIEPDFKTDNEFKAFFKREFDFSEDAALIARLTTPTDKVPLISSYETRLLMQADRGPFFYYFPMIDSRPMRMRNFPMTSLWTVGRLRKTIAQLEAGKPKYIFMERILLERRVPEAYGIFYPELLVILEYVDRNYEPVGTGKFLVAMKRKVN